MPMINSKITMEVPQEKRDLLKSELGKAVSIIGKPESFLMVGFEDRQDLYFGGKKLEKGAYIEVRVLGNIDRNASSRMTEKICGIFNDILGIPGESVYVSYWGTDSWGWNGSNF